MLDDFFTRALIAGIGVAAVTGPLGCVMVWRRLSYFGDTLSHAALLGVALALLMQINIVVSVFVISVLIALLLLYLQRGGNLPSDALLGLMSHSALAIGLVVLTFLPRIQFDLSGLLIGDILAVSRIDIALIFGGGVVVLSVLALAWRELFVATINEEIAKAEGYSPERASLVFMLLLAIVIAISMKIVGVLLITALLIIPAACARRFASGPEQMMFISAIIGVLSVVGGLYGSLQWDTPSGPSIVVAALVFFVASLTPIAGIFAARRGG